MPAVLGKQYDADTDARDGDARGARCGRVSRFSAVQYVGEDVVVRERDFEDRNRPCQILVVRGNKSSFVE